LEIEVNLVHAIEEMDPDHFSKRLIALKRLSNEARSLGFFPLQITQNDLECYWIRLESDKGEHVNLPFELFKYAKSSPNIFEALKKVARYEEPI
jgi:hypothetical protein